MGKRIKTDIETPAEEKESVGESKNLRPILLKDFIGQNNVKESLLIAIESAKKRKATLDHILFYGPPGLGKTTLANIVANEMESPQFIVTVGPNLEKPSDIASLLASLNEGGVLFIDEIHRVNKLVEETLYPAMEDGFIPIQIGQGQQQKTIKLSLPKFTLIGATTRPGLLSPPLRDRFGQILKLDYYTEKDLSKIAEHTSKKMRIEMKKTECDYVAEISRGTPRLINRNIAKIRDYAYARNEGICNMEIARKAMKLSGIKRNGLSEMDIKILSLLKEMNGKAIGLNSIAHSLGEDSSTIEDVYEPYLLMKKYIYKTPKGRIISPEGENVIEKE